MFTVFLLWSGSSFAVGGAADTGGVGDYGKMRIFSWFPSIDPTYCIEVHGNFGLPADQAASNVRQALGKWEKYLHARSADRNLQNKRFIEVSACTAQTNLKFVLGAMPASSSPSLFGKAELESFDKNTHIGKGTIWIRDQNHLPGYLAWTTENNLHAVLMHEIGHTLGVSHIPGTVMAESLSQWINDANKMKRPKLIEEIDVQYELLSSGDITEWGRVGERKPICLKAKYEGLYMYSADTEPGGFNSAISSLVGRKPVGVWHMEVTDSCHVFIYRDELGEARGEIEFIETTDSFPSPGEIFSQVRSSNFLGFWGSVKSAKIKMASGRSAIAKLRFNATPSPFSIDLEEEGRRRPLFRAASPLEIQHERLDERFGIQYSVD
jgi:hypothetical protein